jgi:hypothetical protein
MHIAAIRGAAKREFLMLQEAVLVGNKAMYFCASNDETAVCGHNSYFFDCYSFPLGEGANP